MKKLICFISIICVLSLVLVSCGVDKEEIKEELRGTWSYDFYASAVGQHCHQIYKFSADGSVESAWINDEVPSKSTYDEGTYEISSKQIVITYEDSSTCIIEYSYNNGVLRLWELGSDGSLENELKRN